MSDKSPLVSIALCTYNGSRYLREQLESIFYQTYERLELVIVDDCSTDGTVKIIEQYICKNSIGADVRFFQNEENLGYTKNFEKAIKLCNGEYIALADQDDIWSIDKIQKLVDNVEDNLLIYHDSDFIDQDGKSIAVKMSDVHNLYAGSNPLPFLLFNSVSGHSCMFSKVICDKIFPFSQKHYHDWWIAYVCTNLGSIKYLDESLVKYRRHMESVVSKETSKKNYGTKKRKYYQRLIDKKNKAINEYQWLKQCDEFDYNKKPLLVRFLKRQMYLRLTCWITPLTFLVIVALYGKLFLIRKSKNPYNQMSNLQYLRENYLFGIAGLKIWYSIKIRINDLLANFRSKRQVVSNKYD